MKDQALFSSKDKSKKLKCRLLQFLFGALRVNPFVSPEPKLVNFAIAYYYSTESKQTQNINIATNSP